MNKENLLNEWLQEERAAHIHGWDFSHIHGRYEEENDLPWDYGKVIHKYLSPQMKLLDIDTGGGEFLLSLHPPRLQCQCNRSISAQCGIMQRNIASSGN